MSSEKTQCSHEMCECMVTAELAVDEPVETYCSDYCRDAEETDEGDTMCNCGHPPCDTP